MSTTTSVRGLRILLEYFYATEVFEPIQKERIKIVSVFGSARTKKGDPNYRLAHRLGGLLYHAGFAVVTGASQGIMEAANQGVADAIVTDLGKKKKNQRYEEIIKSRDYERILQKYSAGLKITLPFEASENPYIGVGATFHYFMVRKFFFASLSSAFIACEGGWGTRDELYEMLTLVQTGKAPVMPILYLSKDSTNIKQDLEHTVRKKYINPEDKKLLQFVKTPEEAIAHLRQFYKNVERIDYEKEQTVSIFLKRAIPAALRRRIERKMREMGPRVADIAWRARSLLLEKYSPASYGHLKDIVMLLNTV
ncbi:MAG: LOG family protein [Deltaproteobacteria bacterium]|nr:LOG family protein [Deltaproteobacteria bacterium]